MKKISETSKIPQLNILVSDLIEEMDGCSIDSRDPFGAAPFEAPSTAGIQMPNGRKRHENPLSLHFFPSSSSSANSKSIQTLNGHIDTRVRIHKIKLIDEDGREVHSLKNKDEAQPLPAPRSTSLWRKFSK